MYKTNVAHHVDKAMVAATPFLDEHVHPLLDKGKVHMGPHMEKAKEHYSLVSKHVQEVVLPKIKDTGSKATDAISKLPLDRAISPIFDIIAKIAPKHASALPKGTFERVALLLLGIYAFYVFFGWARLFYKVAKFFIGSVVYVFMMVILVPLKVVFKSVGITTWIGTGFYCCGLCRNRSAKVSNLK